jgi:CubicO group peptidase (beta-lactamase class C family)
MKRDGFLLAAAAAVAGGALLRPARACADDIVVSGAPAPQYADFDNMIAQFMVDNRIRAGQFAFGKNGTVLFSHAYTTAPPPFPRTHTSSIFRVASVSKAFTSAALYTLLQKKKFTLQTKLFPYIGVQQTLLPKQKPDPHINDITIGQAVEHKSGLSPAGDGDLEFQYRAIENAIDAAGPLTQLQFTQYVYGSPLNSRPGDTYAYSNVGYYLLGRVIEKASGMPYMQYLQQAVLDPLGINDVVLSATDASKRRDNEVIYDADGDGLSVLEPRTNKRLPLAYGGATYWETFDSCSDLATSASSLVKLLGSYAAWGVGPRAPKSARAGAMPGTESVIRNREDGIDFAFIFNKRPDGDPFDTNFRRKIEERLDKGV